MKPLRLKVSCMKEAKTDLEISHAFNIFIYAFVLYIYI